MEISVKEKIKRLSEIFNSELRYFYLGSLISSDNLVDVESCEKAIEKTSFIIEHIDEFVLDEPEDKKQILGYAQNGLDIAKQDLDYFKSKEKH